MKERLAVLGGTLDPTHLGHLSILAQVCDLLAADGMLLPAGAPAYRAPVAAAAIRLEMARVAVADTGLTVSDADVTRPGPTYTIDSLDDLQTAHPGREIHFILGADAARGIADWQRSGSLLARARMVIVDRTGTRRINVAEAVRIGFSPERTRLLRVHSPPISASLVRERVAVGAPIAGLVPAGVAAIIERERLYRR